MIAVSILAILTNRWVLMAVPIGFLFGFLLQKGDLCGSSGCSEVLLFRSFEKLGGLWVCIVTSMSGFALLDLLGWVELSPKPLLWLSMIVGGAIFGTGMVLAGGCVTGSLFKAGTGNLNSMAALLGIPIGVGAVRYGFLCSFRPHLDQFVILAKDGDSVTLTTITGLSFQTLALIIAVGTLLAALGLARRRKKSPFIWNGKRMNPLTRSWKPWQAGLGIGLLAMPAYLCSAASGINYPIGTTGGMYSAVLLATDGDLVHVTTAEDSAMFPENGESPAPGRKPVFWWLILLCGSLMAGSWLAGLLSGESRLFPRPPEQVVIAFFGGILIGTGAALGEGCFYGNIVSGWALMSAGGFIFGIAAILSNWTATYFYLMGGRIFKAK